MIILTRDGSLVEHPPDRCVPDTNNQARSAPTNTTRPPTLAERIARFVAALLGDEPVATYE